MRDDQRSLSRLTGCRHVVGRFWEIIAVPDIRVQVAAVADDIAKELQA